MVLGCHLGTEASCAVAATSATEDIRVTPSTKFGAPPERPHARSSVALGAT
jgi:hypothetical protein